VLGLRHRSARVPTVRQLLPAVQLGDVPTLCVDLAALPGTGTPAPSSRGSESCSRRGGVSYLNN
jgi:hypothetical protein